MPEKFQFYLDQKVTTWMRTHFEVEAESLEEATEKSITKYKSGDLYEIGWDEIDGVKEILEVEENGGHSTEELMYTDGTTIYQNGL